MTGQQNVCACKQCWAVFIFYNSGIKDKASFWHIKNSFKLGSIPLLHIRFNMKPESANKLKDADKNTANFPHFFNALHSSFLKEAYEVKYIYMKSKIRQQFSWLSSQICIHETIQTSDLKNFTGRLVLNLIIQFRETLVSYHFPKIDSFRRRTQANTFWMPDFPYLKQNMQSVLQMTSYMDTWTTQTKKKSM